MGSKAVGMMNAYCPLCSRDTEHRVMEETVNFEVRGEIIPTTMKYYECVCCGDRFEVNARDYDPYETVYREYRRRKGMLQPEEIKAFRKKIGLSQGEFGSLFGAGVASINRYENGSLQTESIDRAMQSLTKDGALLRHVNENSANLPDAVVRKIRNSLSDVSPVSEAVDSLVDAFWGYNASEESGYLEFQPDKFFALVQFFCFKENVPKTKLLKELFYCDFGYFKEHGQSITGAKYARIPYGPVPDKYETLLNIAADSLKLVEVREEYMPDYERVKQSFSTENQPNLSLFSAEEYKMLIHVKEFFMKYTAGQISEYSHQEKAWQETSNGHIISYELARNLRER